MTTQNLSSPKILVIRKDNIGDLICTTPMFSALRKRYPNGTIDALVSSYNAEVLHKNQDLNRIYVYERRQGESLLSTLRILCLSRPRLQKDIKKTNYDYIILASGGLRFAKKLDGKTTIGFRERDNSDSNQPDITIPVTEEYRSKHEVEKMNLLLEPLNASCLEEELSITPNAVVSGYLQSYLKSHGWSSNKPTIGIHISSRHPSQRLSAKKFSELIDGLQTITPGVQFLLLWAPGSKNTYLHPGDDEKATEILSNSNASNIYPCPTHTVSEIIAAINLCANIICSDGGAMHIAAGLKRPMICFFGNSHYKEWHPWHCKHIAIQPPSHEVNDISVEEILSSYAVLLNETSCL